MQNDHQPSREKILRSVQKDKEYPGITNKKILDFFDTVSDFFNLDFLHSDKIEILSNFVFYYINYFQRTDQTTPGQEYTSLLKTIREKPAGSLLAYIVIMSMHNYLVKAAHSYTYSLFERKLSQYADLENKSSLGDTYLRKRLLCKILSKITSNFPSLEDLMDKYEEVQFCFFFINGKYIDFIHYLFRVSYISLKQPSQDIIQGSGFKFIGYFLLLKLILEVFIKLKFYFKMYKKERQKLKKEIKNFEQKKKFLLDHKQINFRLKSSDRFGVYEEERDQCLLCLSKRQDTSSTLCGHLFCWACIIKYLQENPTCPFCRKTCRPQNVIYLQNYN